MSFFVCVTLFFFFFIISVMVPTDLHLFSFVVFLLVGSVAISLVPVVDCLISFGSTLGSCGVCGGGDGMGWSPVGAGRHCARMFSILSTAFATESIRLWHSIILSMFCSGWEGVSSWDRNNILSSSWGGRSSWSSVRALCCPQGGWDSSGVCVCWGEVFSKGGGRT